ncbi:hypothetical protein C8R43DRAFT_1020063 [Mycena crocata]|nr:hypothetical protein C8R43DRAFT_1020063 [Mycena crocata]
MREKYGVMDEFAFDRLAQAPLLTLSQVCARWHSIAIDTPSLWTDIFLSSQLWHTPSTTETAFNLLQSALERGKSYPLTVFLTNDDLPVPQSTLSLIAAHSQRWRAVTFDCHLSEIRRLMATDMPRVERIEFGYNIDMVESETEDLSTEISLKSAPHLRRLVFDATLCAHIVNLDREGLDVVRYRHLSSADIDTLVSLMSRLPTKQFQFQFFLDDYTRSPSHTITLGIPPTSSDIWDLSIGIDGEFHKQHCRQALSEILGSLTLPHLHTLAFRSTKYQRFPLLWPQPQFLALIARSSFHLNLRNLSLSHVQITEAQLLQFLPLLTALERLEIADHARVRSRERVGGR